MALMLSAASGFSRYFAASHSGEQEQDQREDDAYHRKGRECDAESLFLLLCAAVRVGLGDEARVQREDPLLPE